MVLDFTSPAFAFAPLSAPRVCCPICEFVFPATSDVAKIAEDHFLSLHKALVANVPDDSRDHLELDFSIPTLSSSRRVPIVMKKKPDIMVLGVCVLTKGPNVGFACYDCFGSPGSITLSTHSMKVTWCGPPLSPRVKLENALGSLASLRLSYKEHASEFNGTLGEKMNLVIKVFFGDSPQSPDTPQKSPIKKSQYMSMIG